MKIIRFLLFPFALVFRLISGIRNYLYDRRIKAVYDIPLKSICVGNLSLGGTGKSPLVAFLANELKQENKVQVLSRGYGRKTKGFFVLNDQSQATEVGDEPLMYHKKMGREVAVAVCESRKEGIERILQSGTPDVLILDDAFQHRKVQAGFSILLTEFNAPYFEDYLFPVGRLRESRAGAKRADILLVTKSPESLTEQTKKEFVKNVAFQPGNVFFSSIAYGDLVSFSESKCEAPENILLVTGIANPKPLEDYLRKKYRVETLRFKDHYQFSLADMEKIHKKFDTFAPDKKAIVTTEKDYVRLVAPEFASFISEKPWYYQEISVKIDRNEAFLNKIKTYVGKI
ncbi:MAG: lpxK [Crocinitomicaceae bacterium]|nr:lpxK [Crocinitomicaceae bacterium]